MPYEVIIESNYCFNVKDDLLLGPFEEKSNLL